MPDRLLLDNAPSNLKDNPHYQLVHAVHAQQTSFEQLINTLMPFINGTQTLTPDLALPLSTALLEIERTSIAQDQLMNLVNDLAAPSLALSEAGQILSLNLGATQLFHVETGDGLRALGIDQQAFLNLKQRLRQVQGPTLVRAKNFQLPAELPFILIATWNEQAQSIILSALQHHWPQSIDHAMKSLFGLSSSECEILSALAQGQTSEQIAAQRQRAITTVRQQIKSILQKLDVHTQVQAATLAAAAVHASGGSRPHHSPMISNDHPLYIHHFYRKQRVIGWRRFGQAEGQPVLFIHGPSFGAGEYEQDRIHAVQQGLDIYAIERPGYGRTSPPEHGEDILECQYQDLIAFLEQQSLKQVTLFAHEVGLIAALQLAVRHPERIKAVLAVSAAPPFLELEQLHRMPDHQAVFIQAARHTPWLARLMIRLMLAQTRRLGPEHWTDVIFQGVEQDMQVMLNPALKPGIIATYSFYLNQMGHGFELDLQMMLKDWTGLLQLLERPLVLIHGSKNATTPVDTLSIFQQLQPAIQLEVIEQAGLTLAVSHTELIYQRLAEMA
ncbi:alpha/beta fold hydrolase [Marinospirillum sp.]|uniref:alpha/beta fold hydrolase n=1 Tax=Marinospirillum sp. TaxID=2183934 RepID=UPI003A87CCAD